MISLENFFICINLIYIIVNICERRNESEKKVNNNLIWSRLRDFTLDVKRLQVQCKVEINEKKKNLTNMNEWKKWKASD